MTEPLHISQILPYAMANIRSRGKVRQRVLKRDANKCRDCGDEAVIACYKTYDDGDIETAEDMISLCAACHDKHELEPNSLRSLAASNGVKVFEAES